MRLSERLFKVEYSKYNDETSSSEIKPYFQNKIQVDEYIDLVIEAGKEIENIYKEKKEPVKFFSYHFDIDKESVTLFFMPKNKDHSHFEFDINLNSLEDDDWVRP